jgi:hypothetical protein
MAFTITPNSGKQFSVSSIVVQWQRSGTGNTQIALRSSVDSFASDLDSVKSVTDNASTQTFTWTFTQANSSSPVTYRLYSFAEAATGSGGPGDGSGNDIVVNGSVSDTATSPTTQATNIILLNADGSSQTGVYFFSGNWVRGGSIVNDEVVPAGKAFMLKNNSGSADHILLVGTPAAGPRNPIALSASGGSFSLLTPARSQPTTLNSLGLTGGNATNSIHPSVGSQSADLVLIPQPDGTFRRYHHDGTKWKSGLRDVADPSTVTVPAGGAFFIRKASDSNFEEWTPPAEE